MTATTTERIHDPVHRVSFRFETEDDSLRVFAWLEPGGRLPEHFHPTLEERWEVLEGTAAVKLDGRWSDLTAENDPVVVARGVRHELRNTSDSVAHLRTEVTPAGRLREFLTESAQAAREGLYNAHNLPRGLRGASWLSEFALRFSDETVMCSPPPALQRALLPTAARLTRRRRRGRSVKVGEPHHGMKGSLFTKAAGWIAIAFGAVHVIVAPLDTRDAWSQVVADGWWDTFTLDESTTLAQFERSETFWVTLGSFGVPVLVLGCYVVWSTRQHHRVPGWIGWIVLAWGLLIVSTLPASPAWALVLSGALIVLGDRRRGRATHLDQAMQAMRERRVAGKAVLRVDHGDVPR